MSDVREQIERPRLVSSLRRTYRVERNDLGNSERLQGHRSEGRLSTLNRALETAVIPSLVIAHKSSNLALECGDPASNDAAELAEQMLRGDIDGPTAHIDTLRSQGNSLEEIYLQLLAPAAVHLRKLWSSDLCGFAEATLALWRLQQLLRNYSVEFRAEADRLESGRRALLAPTPREKHDLSYAMFYLVLMSEFFRRDGWEAWIEPEPTSREFTHVVRREWFDVVEFLVSGDRQLDALTSRIQMIRRESPNRSIGVIVYGQVFIEHPELVLIVGADLAATDVSQSALQSQRLVSLPACPN